MFVVTVFGLIGESVSQNLQTDVTLETNLDRIRAVARNIALATSQRVQPAAKNLHLSVLPKESAWTIEGAVRDALQAEGWSLSEGGAASTAAELGIADVRVEYENIRRDGFLGPKLVDRKVSVTLSAKLFDNTHQRLMLQADVHDSLKDVIELSQVHNLENSALPFTKGTLPEEGLFSSIAEPLILVGSIAVAVLLLFNVRS